MTFQLNVDASVIASPYGFVAADEVVVFQFNLLGQIQPNPPATVAQIYSNLELSPQNTNGLGTYYLVTFYDANGARLNKNPMWWQFDNPANAVVDIGSMTPYAVVGGNIIFYPLLTNGTVTSVTFTGDGTIFSVVPSNPVTVSGTLTPTLLPEAAHAVLIGPTSGGPGLPTFRALVASDIPVIPIVSAIQYVMDGGGSVPTTGSWGQIQIPYNCTITGVTLTSDQVGSAVVDLLLSTYAGFPGSLLSITASDKPTLASAQKYTDSTLTGWTKALVAGDILQIYLDSATTVTRLNLTVTLSIP